MKLNFFDGIRPDKFIKQFGEEPFRRMTDDDIKRYDQLYMNHICFIIILIACCLFVAWVFYE